VGGENRHQFARLGRQVGLPSANRIWFGSENRFVHVARARNTSAELAEVIKVPRVVEDARVFRNTRFETSPQSYARETRPIRTRSRKSCQSKSRVDAMTSRRNDRPTGRSFELRTHVRHAIESRRGIGVMFARRGGCDRNCKWPPMWRSRLGRCDQGMLDRTKPGYPRRQNAASFGPPPIRSR